MSVPVADFDDFARLVRAVEEAAVPVTGLTLSEPSLDDVYLSIAAKAAATAAR